MSDDLSPFERALSTGLRVTRNAVGVPVTYLRGATSLTISNAVQGYTSKQSIDVGGTEQVVETIEWNIGVNELSALGPPESGDIITRVVQGVSHVFSVECLSLGETAWDWSDPGRTQYKISSRKDGASAFEVSEPTGFDLAGGELRY